MSPRSHRGLVDGALVVIPGFNHNIKYKGDIFHVQTEDSGRDRAHIITHLYFGGNIIESRKTIYREVLELPDSNRQIAGLMQKQHKDMLRGLIRGSFDARIKERSSGASFLNGPAPLNVEGGSQHRASLGVGGAASKRGAAQAAPGSAAAGPSSSESKPGSVEPDGAFAVSDNLWEAMQKAAPVILAEDMEAALDRDDDEFVFGKEEGEERLDDIMLGFMKGM